MYVFFFQAEDGIRDYKVTGVQTCALPISSGPLPNTAPAVLRHPSTSSLFATISSECSGQKPRPARNFLLRSWRLLAASTGKPIASWPAANWTSKPGRKLSSGACHGERSIGRACQSDGGARDSV